MSSSASLPEASGEPSFVHLHGPAALTPRLEPWMTALLDDAQECRALLDEHASPVNVIDTGALHRNVDELLTAADEFGVDLFVQVARKANKTLAVVDEARDRGYGIDVGSEAELTQVLARGVAPERVIVTAAVKPSSLLATCLDSGALLALDNLDEADRFAALAAERGVRPRVALRLQPPASGPWVSSRFGEQIETWAAWLRTSPSLDVVGLHFHLHGYDASARAAMLRVAFTGLDAAAFAGHRIEFIDIGGGIPMSYLDDADEWRAFWSLHRALLDTPNPLTWQANPLTNVYPYHQQVVRGAWLRGLLADRVSTSAARAGVSSADAPSLSGKERRSISEELVARGLQLRCEPGRAVLDGVGMTLARVAFRKTTSDGTFVVGLEMNRTQCRSTSDDFLVDPVLVRVASSAPPHAEASGLQASLAPSDQAAREAGAIDAFLVGAYCIENELLLTRRVQVPRDIAVGDVVAFINTGGYLMHILESASHQIPLARNVSRRRSGEPFTLDAIDAGPVSAGPTA